MKKITLVLGLLLAVSNSHITNAESSNANENTIQQTEIAAFKEALKNYREARIKARAEIRKARADYLIARKNATSSELKKEALKKFREARAAALATIPKKPERPKN